MPKQICPLLAHSGHSKLFGRCHYAELNEHSKLIPADPFFSDFSVANAEHCKRRPSDYFAFCHRMAAKSARPVSASVHYPVRQMTHYKVALGNEVMNCCLKLTVWYRSEERR